jgi:hypothetical protein
MADKPIANIADDVGNEKSERDERYVDIQKDYQDKPFATTPVARAERKAIEGRRKAIKDKKGLDRTGTPLTGVALSGGGIRSAAFNLGALQALHAYSGIESIDYLSTVSGGGYIGCCLTAALAAPKDKQCKKNEDEKLPEFPFIRDPKLELYVDTPAVRHIRDYSNYLKPHGLPDLVSSIYVIARGVVANALIIAPVLLLLASFTLWNHPSVDALSQPSIILHWLFSRPAFGPLKDFAFGLHGFWNTAILAVVNIALLILWAIVRTLQQFTANFGLKDRYAIFKVFSFLSRMLFYLTLFFLAFDIHILILRSEAGARLHSNASEESTAFANWLPAWIFSKDFQSALALIGAIVAYFSKYLGEVAVRTARSPFWIDWFKKIAASAALWFAALIVPLLLWDLCLWLSLIGLMVDGNAASYPFAPHWLADFAIGPQNIFPFLTAAAWLYLFVASVIVLATFCIDPNTTSLHSLYEKRLSDAFLFDPDPSNSDPEHRDLKNIPDYAATSASFRRR